MNLMKMGILIFIVVLSVGCSSAVGPGSQKFNGKNVPPPRVEIINANYRAGDDLLNILAARQVRGSGIILTTFVNLDNLSETSALGRIIPQQMATRLIHGGHEIIDLRLRTDTLLVRQYEGEFALSRKIEQIARDKQACWILVGTYSVVYDQIYVNAKILQVADGLTMAAADYSLPYDRKALRSEINGDKTEDKDIPEPNVYTTLN
ncbi:MAG: hypothetical protein LC631_05325 [Desulfovibrionales bacterium]|nr:hypothetical protein [Desulfovibrionales bacterium]